ncbi:hypothetical protein [Ralstonia sp. GP101]|uniref:hypothetical protein n=2 Tax=Burkholderiaceae TaxID=119060 RepID=UPI0003F79ED9
MAVAMAYGPQAGLEIVDTLPAEPALRSYHLLPSVRADFLARLNRLESARVEYERPAPRARSRVHCSRVTLSIIRSSLRPARRS